MSDPKTTILTFLLDETGSMQSIKDDTIGGFNAYLDSLKSDPSPLEFTLLKFDSNHVDKVYVGAPLADVQPLTPETYRPGASTPLIDAAYKAILATDAVVADHAGDVQVLVVIQTDGQENCSTEYTRADLAQLVKARTAAGWGFVFLGAGMDAFEEAGSFGISASNTLRYGRNKSDATFDAIASNTMSYRSGGEASSLSFNAQQRSSTDDGDAAPKAPPLFAPPSLPRTTPSVRSARKPIVDDIVIAGDKGA